jgi:hypothetical protein
MQDKISAREIAELIRLRKLKAELSFKREFLVSGSSKEALADTERELKSVESHLNSLEAKLKAAKLIVVLPNENRINELGAKLENVGHSAIASALKSKSGDTYAILAERGKLLKQNFELRSEIGKLNILLHRLTPDLRESLSNSVRVLDLSENSVAAVTDEKSKQQLGRILSRMAVVYLSAAAPAEECEFNLDNQKIWIPKAAAAEIAKNMEDTNKIIAKVQLQNAERQIRKFSDEEEATFLKTQQEYLALLKHRDELLKQHLDECSESIELS